MKLCKDCGIKPCKRIKPMPSRPKLYFLARCIECNKKYNNNRRFKVRQRTGIEIRKQNVKLIKTGWKICIECKRKRELSEYNTSLPNRQGVINDICDTCLTKHYIHNNKDCNDFTPRFWRKKAYSCNTVARNRLTRANRRIRNSKLIPVHLKELNYECKPQDLVKLWIKQDKKCYYCRVLLTTKNMWIEHQTALGANGLHHITNLALTCIDCNTLKRTRSEIEFKQFLQEYAKRILAIES